jgi:hypothetical protein
VAAPAQQQHGERRQRDQHHQPEIVDIGDHRSLPRRWSGLGHLVAELARTVELKIPRRTPSLIVPAGAIVFDRDGLHVLVVENGIGGRCDPSGLLSSACQPWQHRP